MRESTRRFSGWCRLTFQPTTTSSPPRISSRNRGRSAGSSCRSASIITAISAEARRKPAARASALPHCRRRRTPFTRASAACRSEITVPGLVGAAVVDEDHFVARVALEAQPDAFDELGEALGLVERWHDDRIRPGSPGPSRRRGEARARRTRGDRVRGRHGSEDTARSAGSPRTVATWLYPTRPPAL